MKRFWERRTETELLDTNGAQYHWRCECGAHSRGGFLSEPDAEYAAQRHQWGKGVGHPMPETHSMDGRHLGYGRAGFHERLFLTQGNGTSNFGRLTDRVH